VLEIVRELAGSSVRLGGVAGVMSEATAKTRDQSVAATTSSRAASAEVQSVACATAQVTASIHEIERQIARSHELATLTADRMQGATGVVQSLVDDVQSIGEVVRLISEVAGQTNLLALNATIEAARAGAAGKGFSVVAAEVKALAGQTSRATEEIGARIHAVKDVTRQVAQAIENEAATAISAAVQEQGAATDDISGAIERAARNVEVVSSAIDGVNAAVADTGRSADGISEVASVLSSQTKVLGDRVEDFLGRLRQA
jgi:methyl-accepting chemotaxis protein